MFKMALTPSYWAQVVVETANNKGGFDKSTFMVEFKRCNADELEELRTLPQKDVLERVLMGWKDLVGENDEPVPFNPNTRAALYSIPQAALALVEAFWKSIFKSPVKN